MFLESKLLDKIMSTSTHLSKLGREHVQPPQDSFTPLLSTDFNYCLLSTLSFPRQQPLPLHLPHHLAPLLTLLALLFCDSLTHSQCLITGIPIAGLFSAHFIYNIYKIIFIHLLLPVQLPTHSYQLAYFSSVSEVVAFHCSL